MKGYELTEFGEGRLQWFEEQINKVVERKRGRPNRPLEPEEWEKYDGPFETAGHRSTLESHEMYFGVREAFACGLNMATTILCAAIVEQILSGELESMGIRDEEEDLTLGRIIHRVKEYDILTDSELKRVEDLKATRESFLHYRGWEDERSVLYRRLQEEGEDFDERVVAYQEAKEAVKTMLEIRHIIWSERRERVDSSN